MPEPAGIAIVETACCAFAILADLKSPFRFPSDKTIPDVADTAGFNVAKLFVGVSITTSVFSRLIGNKLLPCPELSAPTPKLGNGELASPAAPLL